MKGAALRDEFLAVTEAKDQLPRRLSQLSSGELERVVVIRRSSPVAVILTIESYQHLQDLEKKQEEIDDILQALKAKAADDGTRISLDELEGRLRSL